MGKEIEVDAICDGTDILIPGIMEHIERTGVHSGDSISVYPAHTISEKAKETLVEYTKRLAQALHVVGMINIQFIDMDDNIYVIEVNPRSSRTVPYISKVTGIPIVDLAARIIMGETIKGMGYTPGLAPTADYIAIKMPVFSVEKLRGAESSLGPEMKSTGEAIGYDRKFPRAMYKALIASGVKMQNYGTVMVTLADEDKEEALPLIRRFYEMGFNIEATVGTGEFLKAHGIRTRIRRKLSENSTEILEAIRSGYVSYVINTRAILSGVHYEDGLAIRRTAIENNVTMFTSLDTVKVLLDVLEEITIGVSPLYA